MNFTEDGPVGEADPWKARLDLVKTLVENPSRGAQEPASSAAGKPAGQ